MGTQKEIAQKLGVTPVLVSRALSGHSSVASTTRARIVEAAKKMGYGATSNIHARTMAARRHGKKIATGMYAVVLPSFGDNAGLRNNPFFSRLLAGVENEALERDQELIISTYRAQNPPRWLREGEVDGVVCLNWDPDFFQTMRGKDLPYVTVQDFYPGALGIASAEREGMRLVTEYLLGLGHRRLAYLGLRGPGPSQRRLHGFHDALRASGLSPDDALVNVSHNLLEDGAEIVRELLASSGKNTCFTALVCHNDMMAMQAVRALERQGLRVPEDVSVTGFDDLSAAQHFEPQLTGVAYDLCDMGQRAMQMLLETGELETHHGNGKEQHEMWPVELAVRASTRAAAKT